MPESRMPVFGPLLPTTFCVMFERSAAARAFICGLFVLAIPEFGSLSFGLVSLVYSVTAAVSSNDAVCTPGLATVAGVTLPMKVAVTVPFTARLVNVQTVKMQLMLADLAETTVTLGGRKFDRLMSYAVAGPEFVKVTV